MASHGQYDLNNEKLYKLCGFFLTLKANILFNSKINTTTFPLFVLILVYHHVSLTPSYLHFIPYIYWYSQLTFVPDGMQSIALLNKIYGWSHTN